jgi:hypothetical protein
MPAPTTSSRHLYTGHHQGNKQAAPWLRARPFGRAFVPGIIVDPGFDAIVRRFDASAVVHSRSSSRRTPNPLVAGLFLHRSGLRLLTGAPCRWFGIPACTATPEDQTLHDWHSTVRAGNLLRHLHSPFRFTRENRPYGATFMGTRRIIERHYGADRRPTTLFIAIVAGERGPACSAPGSFLLRAPRVTRTNGLIRLARNVLAPLC